MVRMAGGHPVFVPLRPTVAGDGESFSSQDWQLDPDELASKFTSRTKAVVLNTPNNPLGKVFSQEELGLLAALCVQHDVLCISDEVYQWLVYNGRDHVSIATLPGMWERTLTIGSAGKTFSVTGWKVGWVLGPDRLLKHLRTVHQNSVYHCATQAQEAVAKAWERELAYQGQPDSYLVQLPQAVQQNRDRVVRGLLSVGMRPVLSQGTYFLIADISAFKDKMPDLPGSEEEPYDSRFVKWMIKNRGLMAMPVSIFFSPAQKRNFDHYIRFCFVKGEDQKVDWRKWKQERKEEKKKWKEVKLVKKLEKQRAQEELKKHQEEEEKQKKSNGRSYTLSVALPGSILNNAQSPELRTYLAGQIARACAIFCVDEIVVFDEEGEDSRSVEGKFDGIGKKGQACVQLARILQYLECPQYLRKSFFPKHQDLQFAGLLNPLDGPHHMRQDETSEYREGVVLARPSKPGRGSFVNCGMRKEVQIDKQLEPGLRVTVRLDQRQIPESKSHKGRVVSSQEPRTEAGLYWGYSVRLASCLSAVFAEGPFKDGYDLTVGTSERGGDLESAQLPDFCHALVVFGGLQGLEAAVDADPNLQVVEPSVLFDLYLNTCPNQGSRTIRTEEAILISLASLRPRIVQAGAKPS
ncbi:putative methyltransferase C9orf114 isoform X3 [Tachyglossus aculeatus]|nr:putative methyltransferase C9orf114 isoform X3 [Tachyglossus aculeatus]